MGKITAIAKNNLDELFSSYDVVAEGTSVFVCDMKYDYSRWSKKAVEYFGLPSEYMVNAGEIWAEHIHPDDRKAFLENIDALFKGTEKSHD
nr:PAS domain-containing protein [Lachnospiraceae bacterium]